MKKYAFTFSGRQTFSGPITRHSFLLRCMPGTYPFQRSYAHKLTVTPFAALTHIVDVYGNEMYTGTIDKKHDSFQFIATGFVLCSKYLIHEPLDRLHLYPTWLTQPNELTERLLSGLVLPEEPCKKAEALCQLVHDTVAFVPVSEAVTATDALEAGAGDAKDLAQLHLVLCRRAGLAARFVSGLALGIDQPHCWTEVYCGNAWRAFDPSVGTVIEEGYLKMAHGPDSCACALGRGCFKDDGTVTQTRGAHVTVTEHVITTRDTVPHA